MIAVIPESMARHFAHHGLLRVLPYAFTHSLASWCSLVYRDRHINAVMQRFLYLMHDRRAEGERGEKPPDRRTDAKINEVPLK